MINEYIVAERLYTTYCQAVGGVNFKGDPLPDWEEFYNDESKRVQSTAWLKTAEAAMDLLLS